VSDGEGAVMFTCSFITNSDYPIGSCVGDALELVEVLLAFKGCPLVSDLECLVTRQGKMMLQEARYRYEEGEDLVREVLKNGAALAKFQHMLVTQGVELQYAQALCEPGNKDVLAVLAMLGCSGQHVTDLKCVSAGFIHDQNSLIINEAVKHLIYDDKGKRTGSAGVHLLHKVGDPVLKDTVWARVYHKEQHLSEDIKEALDRSLVILAEVCHAPDIIYRSCELC